MGLATRAAVPCTRARVLSVVGLRSWADMTGTLRIKEYTGTVDISRALSMVTSRMLMPNILQFIIRRGKEMLQLSSLMSRKGDVTTFKFNVKSTHKSCLERQITEGCMIHNSEADIVLNGKSEFHQP